MDRHNNFRKLFLASVLLMCRGSALALTLFQNDSGGLPPPSTPWYVYGPWVAALVALVVGATNIVFAFIMWRFNEISMRRQTRQDHIRMLLDADRALIDRPDLWRIYGDVGFPKISRELSESEKDAQALSLRLKAFIYYYLNMYEAVHAFYSSMERVAADPQHELLLGHLVLEDQGYYDAWKSHLKYFLAQSREAREIIKTAVDRKEFSSAFLNLVAELSPEGSGLREHILQSNQT